MGCISLATSGYRCPAIIPAIAADLEPQCFRERHSLNMVDARKYGLRFDSIEDGHLYWSIQDYIHPLVLPLSVQARSKFQIMLFEDYQPRYDQHYRWQIEAHGAVLDADVECHALTEVHVETYRTPDYMLSCAQDFRPGKPGYQQHIWQATLGLDAVVFTNHPASDNEFSRPNYWAGNGIIPRAAQHENVLICVHHLPGDDTFLFSHAYFPRNAFNEVVEQGQWICAHKDDGYIALYSQHPTRWLPDGDQGIGELRVDTPDNIWVVEMGRRADWGSFEAFVQAVTGSAVACTDLTVRYHSPSQGEVTFGWSVPLTVKGQEIELHSYGRFDNRYCRCEFASPIIEIQRQGEQITLDFTGDLV
jgi:hypothetical protein